jgi:heme A synthase
MVTAEIANRAAWITALLLGAQASLGLIRVRVLSRADNSIRRARAWVLTGHAVIGLALPLLALAHGWFSMKLPGIRGTRASGLWIATAALLLLGVQAVTGMTMLRLKEPQRIADRRLHLAMAVLLVALAGAHVFLN